MTALATAPDPAQAAAPVFCPHEIITIYPHAVTWPDAVKHDVTVELNGPTPDQYVVVGVTDTDRDRGLTVARREARLRYEAGQYDDPPVRGNRK
ncbi:MAG: hypothetical protein V3W41_22520 [Planctomycetota bacterium]